MPAAATWNDKNKRWVPRKYQLTFTPVGRMYSASPKQGERFYLRVLLNDVAGATSFDDLKTVNGVVCETFHEACIRRGLCADDRQWRETMQENVLTAPPRRLRSLFCIIVLLPT